MEDPKARTVLEARERHLKTIIKEWLYLPIVGYLTFGCSRVHLARIFHSLPPNVALKFKSILQKVQKILNDRLHALLHWQCMYPPHLDEPACADVETELWQSQNICGYLKCTYDPFSHKLLDVQFNDKLPQLLGLARDEFRNKISNHGLELPCPEVDFFFLLIDETKHSTQCKTER